MRSADVGWMERGNCRDAEPNTMMPRRGSAAHKVIKTYCDGHGFEGPCPVRVECLEYALSNSMKVGVWGGTTGRERGQLVAARKAKRIVKEQEMAE